jgi:hypothetical protein
MKREDEKKELARALPFWESGTLFEKVLFERKDNGIDSLRSKPFVIVHLENGVKVKQESFPDRDEAMKAFGGGAA